MNTLNFNYNDELVTTNSVESTDLSDNGVEVGSAISDTLQAPTQSFGETIKEDASANDGVLGGLYASLFEYPREEVTA